MIQIADLDLSQALEWVQMLSLQSHNQAEWLEGPVLPSDSGVRKLPEKATTHVLVGSVVELALWLSIATIPWLLAWMGVYRVPTYITIAGSAIAAAIWLVGLVGGLIESRKIRWQATERWVRSELTLIGSSVSVVLRRGVLSYARSKSPLERRFGLNRVSLRTVGGGSPDLELHGLQDIEVEMAVQE